MASVPTASKGRAYSKSSTDGFMGGSTASNPKRGSSDRPLGPELVAQGDFYSDTRWIVGAEWTIGFGRATGVPATSSAITQPTDKLVSGDSYQVKIEVVANAGTVQVQFTGGTQVDSASLGTGVYTFDQVAGAGNANIAIRKDITFDGYVEYVSVRHVDPV